MKLDEIKKEFNLCFTINECYAKVGHLLHCYINMHQEPATKVNFLKLIDIACETQIEWILKDMEESVNADNSTSQEI